MTAVDGRNVNILNKCTLAVAKFYSRIVLNHLSEDAKKLFRKLERSTKTYIKIKADIRFLSNNYK